MPPSGRNTIPGAIPITTQAAASTAMPVCIAHGTSHACAASALRGRPRKATPYTLAKQAAASPPINASTPAISGRTIAGGHIGQVRAGHEAAKGKPLADEAVEQRQSHNRAASDEKDRAGHAHPLEQSAKLFKIQRMSGIRNGAGAQEQAGS